MSRREAKYSWIWRPYDDWLKKEAKEVRDDGIKIDTAGITKLLLEDVLIPNKVKMRKVISRKHLTMLWEDSTF